MCCTISHNQLQQHVGADSDPRPDTVVTCGGFSTRRASRSHRWNDKNAPSAPTTELVCSHVTRDVIYTHVGDGVPAPSHLSSTRSLSLNETSGSDCTVMRGGCVTWRHTHIHTTWQTDEHNINIDHKRQTKKKLKLVTKREAKRSESNERQDGEQKVAMHTRTTINTTHYDAASTNFSDHLYV